MKLSFEDYLKKENLSQHTISVYLWTVDYFISNYKDFNTENLHAYKGYLMEFFKPKTVNLRIQAIYGYFNKFMHLLILLTFWHNIQNIIHLTIQCQTNLF